MISKIMSQNILRKAKEIKEKHLAKNNAELRDRIRYEAKNTIAYINRQYAKGKSNKEIIKDLNGSIKNK